MVTLDEFMQLHAPELSGQTQAEIVILVNHAVERERSEWSRLVQSLQHDVAALRERINELETRHNKHHWWH